MTEYKDLHNNIYKVIQHTLSIDEDGRENILDDLFNIFTKTQKHNKKHNKGEIIIWQLQFMQDSR